MYPTIFLVHKYVVLAFLLIYIIKTFLLMANKAEGLANFTRVIKVPEMIISFTFLVTGIYLALNYPFFDIFLIIKIAAVAISIPLAVVGFKKSKKPLALASLLLLFTAYGLAEMHKNMAPKKQIRSVVNQGSTAQINISLGASIYQSGCQACHGANGDAAIAGAANLKTSTLSPEEAKNVIIKGRNSMPKFGYLEEEELNAVLAHIQLLKK